MVNTLIVSIIISWLAGLPAISTSGLIIAQTSGLPFTSPLTFSCEGWGGTTEKDSDNKPQAMQNDTSQACTDLYFSGYLACKNRLWQEAFDTLTYFIETCPHNSFAPNTFHFITTAVAGLYGSDGGSYRNTYLKWLESVLYLNTSDAANSGYIAQPSKESKPQSVLDTSQAACEQLYYWGLGLSNNQKWLPSYDSLKKFVETCPNAPDAYRAFDLMSQDVQQLERTDTALWSSYQIWLRSVLYLNTTNPEYFCQCLASISGFLYYPGKPVSDSALLKQTNVNLAVLRWEILNTSCDTPFLWQEYKQSRLSQYQTWQTDSSIGIHYPLDTTLPSMHDLGLDTLLARHFLYAVERRPQGVIVITSAIASPNPGLEGTVLHFNINKESYVRLELYDVLGNRVEIPPLESLFEAGDHAVPLSLHNLASGTYYVRLVTAYGEAQTVKIVKQ